MFALEQIKAMNQAHTNGKKINEVIVQKNFTKKGQIVLKQHGLITTYECTCKGMCEAGEMGYTCFDCGATKTNEVVL